MNFTNTTISYKDTNAFSPLVQDYLDNDSSLQSFYKYFPDSAGVEKAISDRKSFPVNRKILVDILLDQYADVENAEKVKENINRLLDENCFTICTAHQPNIFTGHLYFIYKILHAISLAESLEKVHKGKFFVPVYYMGSEDADLDELGEIHINGVQYKWQTSQTGAVGRMIIDKEFISLISQIAGQLSVTEKGIEILEVVRKCYTQGVTIEHATFSFVHYLFGKYGLVILLPDNALLKNEFSKIIAKELNENFSEKAVGETIANFPLKYKVQAAGRDINLFYLKDNIRERILENESGFVIAKTNIHFTREELLRELKLHPERFSPNVILRPLFQEMILPNVAFIGGGGELAYWLELKKVFDAANVFFPVLVLRNSFSIVSKKNKILMDKIGLLEKDFFEKDNQLLAVIVKKESEQKLDLIEEKKAIKKLYDDINESAIGIDNSLSTHVLALHKQALKRIEVLEKKMLKAEKKKFEAQKRQIVKVKNSLMPNAVLQERIDNVLQYIGEYGIEFINDLYLHSSALDQRFTILTEK